METTTHVRERAIVVGGGMVGMAVASALSRHFQEVVVIEGDALPRCEREHRPGVPQSWHFHTLSLRGQHELEALFPGFVDRAVGLGAVRLDHGKDMAAFTDVGWAPQFKSDCIALSATRTLLEFAQRERFVNLHQNVVLVEGTRVVDLITEPDGGRLRAVGVITDRDGRPALHADLVVDCSGQAAHWKSWFERRGVVLPRETVVDSHCGYSSRFYRPRAAQKYSWKSLIVESVYPTRPRWGAILPIEGKDWVVTLAGFNGDYPPSDDQGFLEFAKELGTPLFHDALRSAEPLTSTRTFRKLEMRWNHFESYHHPISRFLVIGDAAWAYNPLYGQGVSIGATCARILRDLLAENGALDTLPARYYERATEFSRPAWTSTALLDMRWPKTEGRRPWYGRSLPLLGELFLHAGLYDEAVCQAQLKGAHLLVQPRSLARPRVIAGFALYFLRWLLRTLPRLSTDRPHSDLRSE